MLVRKKIYFYLSLFLILALSCTKKDEESKTQGAYQDSVDKVRSQKLNLVEEYNAFEYAIKLMLQQHL